jgi:hypothetical protein
VWGLAGGLAVIVPLSFLTRAPEAAALKGLVFDPNADRSEGNAKLGWWRTPAFFAAAVLVVFAILNILFR